MKLEKEYTEFSSKFDCKIFRYQNNIIFHVIVPSVKKDYITYDVIIEVNYDTKSSEAVDANNLEFKCFSNCPSFIFTYANTFKQRGLLCKWLENKYKKEVKFDGCKYKRKLPFDFQVFITENFYCLIEIDGDFHHRPQYSTERFYKQQERDKIKDIFCKENNIPLLRINDWLFREPYSYKNILQKFLDDLQR